MSDSHLHPQVAALAGSAMSRRTLLRGLAAGASLAAVPGLAACGGDSSGGSKNATSLGSNFSDQVPHDALGKSIAGFTKSSGIDVNVNTVDHEKFQEKINAYLQAKPQDVWAWFAGYRMQFFADRGFAGDLTGLWDKTLSDQYTDAFKQASTGPDGKQYFVPFYYYPWAVFYRKSLFQEKGYTVPKTLDDLMSLSKQMQSDGLTPIGFADQEGWPAMGTFDILNLRTNGYDFHLSLMKGEESWESDQVKQVFDTWRQLLPYHQEGALGLDWLDAAPDLLNKKTGMYYIGMFVGQSFKKKQDREDLDFFPFPEINPEHGQDTIEAPIDGWMLSAEPDNKDTALKLLEWFGTAEGQEVYLRNDPNNVAASTKADTSGYSSLQKKASELVGAAGHITQFMDRDTRPDFASTVMIPSLQSFLKKPDDIDNLCSRIEKQKQSIFG
ncbi:MAG: ABC transporter substrate-binding protein [Nocardioidaceae bacterium]